MEAKIKNWQQELEEITNDFEKDFQGVSPSLWDRVIDDHTWSIAENVRHLIVINESYFPIFGQLVKGDYEKPFAAKIRFLANLTGNMILKSVDPGNPKKQLTLAMWNPNKLPPAPANELMEKFKQHQKELSGWIERLQPFLEEKQIIHSPANRMIAYPLETAIKIIISHEKRHLQQARKLKKQFTT